MAKALRIALFGNGNLGKALAARIPQVGFQLVAHFDSRGELTSGLSLDQLTHDTVDMALLAVPDSIIPELAATLPSITKIHCSGATSMDMLGEGPCGVFWPIQTFSGEIPVESWSKVTAVYQSNDDSVKTVLLDFASRMAGSVFEADDQQRLKLHLGAVFVNNFSNLLLGMADRQARATGHGLEVFRSLWEQTYENALTKGSKNAQTGPAKRGDLPTMQKHLELLEDGEKEIYLQLSKAIGELFDKK